MQYGLIIYFGGWEVDNDLTDFEGMFKGFLAVLLAAMGLAQVQLTGQGGPGFLALAS